MSLATERKIKPNPAHLRESVGNLTFQSSFHQIGERIHELMAYRIADIQTRHHSFQNFEQHNEVVYLRSIYRRKEREILKREGAKGGVKVYGK